MTSPATSHTNLLGLPRAELETFVAALGSKPFRARQLLNWVYKRGEGSIANMTDLAKDFRAQLAEVAEIRVPDIVTMQHSSDGTRKWKLSADASQAFEMVFIPEKDRGTLCISSQVGCLLDCSPAPSDGTRHMAYQRMFGNLSRRRSVPSTSPITDPAS